MDITQDECFFVNNILPLNFIQFHFDFNISVEASAIRIRCGLSLLGGALDGCPLCINQGRVIIILSPAVGPTMIRGSTMTSRAVFQGRSWTIIGDKKK